MNEHPPFPEKTSSCLLTALNVLLALLIAALAACGPNKGPGEPACVDDRGNSTACPATW